MEKRVVRNVADNPRDPEGPVGTGDRESASSPAQDSEELLCKRMGHLLKLPIRMEQVSHSMQRIGDTQDDISQAMRDMQGQFGVIAQRVDCIEDATRQSATLLRSHFRDRVMRPLASGLAAVVDMVEDMVRHQSISEDVGEALKQTITSLLNDYGVTEIAVAAGDPFDARLCRPVSFISGTDQKADGAIADVVRPGYLGEDGEVIRPAQVVVVRRRGSERKHTTEEEAGHECRRN